MMMILSKYKQFKSLTNLYVHANDGLVQFVLILERFADCNDIFCITTIIGLS